MELKVNLELVAVIATAIGVLIAASQLFLGRKEAQASRDLEITLKLAENFRVSWENSWRAKLREISEDVSREGKPSEEHLDELLNMLNWINWLGTFLDKKQLSSEEVLFHSLKWPIEDIIRVGRAKVEEDIRDKGASYWKGLLVVGDRLGVDWIQKIINKSSS